MLKASCFITGDDYSMVVNDTPKSKKKIYSLASLVLIPTTTWLAIGFLIGRVYLGFEIISSLLIGVVIGFFIFIIERAIIMSNGNRKLVKFRYVIGFLAATLASIFIDEAFFHADIQHRVKSLKSDYSRKEGQKAAENYDVQEKLPLFKSELNAQQKLYEGLDTIAISEAEGSSPSGRTGVGEIAKLKLAKAEEARKLYEQKQAEYSELLKERKNLIQKAKDDAEKNFDENGFLIRIKALYQLVFSDVAVFFIYLVFTLLVGAFEFMVIQFKLNSEETNYERRIRLIDEIGARRMQLLNNMNHPVYDGGLYLKEFSSVRKSINKREGIFVQ